MVKEKLKVKKTQKRVNRFQNSSMTNVIKTDDMTKKISEMVKDIINSEMPQLANNTLFQDLVLYKVFKSEFLGKTY